MSSENVPERWDARRERVENELDDEGRARIARDAVRGVRALSLAVDTLGRIAEFGGVQGEWSAKALGEINDILEAGFRSVRGHSPERERELREDSFVPTRAALKLARATDRLEDELDAATGQGRR